MNTKVLFIIFFASVWCVDVGAIGGGDYISITEAPYYVSLGDLYGRGSVCGGAILSDYWIITAAHCTGDLTDRMQIYTGKTTDESDGIVHYVEKAFVHPDYEPSASKFSRTFVHNDIALLKLDKPIEFNEYQHPIKISSKALKDLDTVSIVGLGLVSAIAETVSLKKTEMKVTMSRNVFTVPTMIVMVDNYSEACNGDSGSPIVRDGKLIGTLSMVQRCRAWQRRNEQKMNWITPTYIYYDWVVKHAGLSY